MEVPLSCQPQFPLRPGEPSPRGPAEGALSGPLAPRVRGGDGGFLVQRDDLPRVPPGRGLDGAGPSGLRRSQRGCPAPRRPSLC
ncbi:hypothetical protein D623_10002739 [Myotis brandtii]|uniref:Uncharacterized protein n=1 Tax=Myotis brandtii TaxID=109478 RepID=S7MVH0_MYOBR|nr:hypothetical protein D623_10002739 [Myotis brandtii]